MTTKLAAALRIALDNGADLTGVNLVDANFYGADFTSADLRSCVTG